MRRSNVEGPQSKQNVVQSFDLPVLVQKLCLHLLSFLLVQLGLLTRLLQLFLCLPVPLLASRLGVAHLLVGVLSFCAFHFLRIGVVRSNDVLVLDDAVLLDLLIADEVGLALLAAQTEEIVGAFGDALN